MPMVWIFKIWPTCGKVTTQATNFLWILRTYAANKEIALCLFLFLRRLSKKAWHLVWKSKVFFFFNPRKLHAFFSLFLSDAIRYPYQFGKTNAGGEWGLVLAREREFVSSILHFMLWFSSFQHSHLDFQISIMSTFYSSSSFFLG